jgi:hypothetical protein
MTEVSKVLVPVHAQAFILVYYVHSIDVASLNIASILVARSLACTGMLLVYQKGRIPDRHTGGCQVGGVHQKVTVCHCESNWVM